LAYIKLKQLKWAIHLTQSQLKVKLYLLQVAFEELTLIKASVHQHPSIIMKHPLFLLFLTATTAFAQPVSIRDTTYLNRPYYAIYTTSATYLFDRAGGGIASMLDRDGRDWIAFRSDSTVGTYPRSARGWFRGIPNAVFGNTDGGVGHPGFDKATSERTADNVISTRSLNGKWLWYWTFYPNRAEWTVTQTDPDWAYWFLYEGTPGGSWGPVNQKYWGTDAFLNGPNTDFYKKQQLFGAWQWAYFGDKRQSRVLFVAQKTPDDQPDTMSFLGNTVAGIDSPDGMVVFGLGRNKEGRATMKTPNTFVIGFFEENVQAEKNYKRLTKQVKRYLK
jgi:hypothetical protein